LVVTYGEHVGLGDERQMFSWSAVRLADRALFHSLVRPSFPPSPERLRHMGLTQAQVESAPTVAEVGERFREFAGDAAATAWSQSTLDLLPLVAPKAQALLLKALYCNYRQGGSGHLDEAMRRENLPTEAMPIPGRAGARLGNALAMTRWLLTQAYE
jgi:hypothetical protein